MADELRPHIRGEAAPDDATVIVPGAIVVADDADAPAVVEVVDILPKLPATSSTCEILSGSLEDYIRSDPSDGSEAP